MLKGLSCLLLFCVALAHAADKVNLTGSWVLDQTKSFSNGAGFDQSINIEQKGDEVTIKAKQKTPRGEVEINEVYSLNGKPTDYTPQGGPNLKGIRKASWLPSGQGILIEDEVTQDGKFVRRITRKWVLSADKASLTIDYFIDDPQRGEFEQKRVFVKQS
jgi:hypothetical protein